MLGLKKDIRVRRERRRSRIQKQIKGTTTRPRLVVFRSLRHIYAQVIDDTTGRTIVAVSSLVPGVVETKPEKGGKSAIAKLVGAEIAKRALEKGIQQVVFDRNIYAYHGRIKALADSAREHGLQF